MIRRVFNSNLVPLALFSYSSYQLFLKPAFNLGAGVYNHSSDQGLISHSAMGATNGIGEEFADQLAKEGFNLVLVGRSAEKLAKKQQQLEKYYPNHRIETRQLDLSSQSLEDYQNLAKSLDPLDIRIVVNNAGVLTYKPVCDQNPQNLQNLVNTNLGPYVYLTHLLLPKLKKREQKSSVIFTSSNAAIMVRPGLAIYAASKTFNEIFARKLNQEVNDKVDTLCFKPSFVTSNMIHQKPKDVRVISTEQAARCALDKLSYDSVTIGSWKHTLFVGLMNLAAECIPDEKRYGMIMSSFKKIGKKRLVSKLIMKFQLYDSKFPLIQILK